MTFTKVLLLYHQTSGRGTRQIELWLLKRLLATGTVKTGGANLRWLVVTITLKANGKKMIKIFLVLNLNVFLAFSEA